MFSQWATKRICKFFMKRLLGRMLRSELDLEQLEVQLGFGTIQLKDLFLNTEYLNDQLGDASLAIKEGSIGSVRAKIPWKVLTAESCEIEVDELKLVIVPRHLKEDGGRDDCDVPGGDDLRFVDTPQASTSDADPSGLDAAGGGAYMGVDDGVRMIAKMVERVLLGLRVKITNMIIVFEEQQKLNFSLSGDPGVEAIFDRSTAPHCLLIARVAYMEYGVEAPHFDFDDCVKVATGTEPSMLVKVVNFRGATLEVVDVQDEIVKLEKATSDKSPVNMPRLHFIGLPISILVGEGGGLNGSIQLSVPWKDGTSDVPKVHADFDIGPLELKISPHQIQQLLNLVQAFSQGGRLGVASSPVVPIMNSVMPSGGSIAESRGYNAIAADKDSEALRMFSGSLLGIDGRRVEGSSSNTAFLPVTRFISDWMHWAGTEGQQRKDGAVAEADLAASVDEFFECFDGTRSSQAGINSSGMWNWTRSAFSAITAASSLAAGSIALAPGPPKQPEYSMKARLSRISLDLYYDCTVTQKHFLVPTRASELFPLKEVSKQARASLSQTSQNAACWEGGAEEHLSAELLDINLSLMVLESQTELTATIGVLDISELVMTDGEEMKSFWRGGLHSCSEDTLSLTHHLQSSIEQVLPSFPARLSSSERMVVSPREDLTNQARKIREQERVVGEMMTGSAKYEKKQLLRVPSGPDYAAQMTIRWHHPLAAAEIDSGQMEIAAFLKPVVIWLDVHTLKRIELLFQKLEGSASKRNATELHTDGQNSVMAQPHNLEKRHGLDINENAAATLDRGTVQVKLFAPSIRMIICFPVIPELGYCGLQKDFVALDLNAPSEKLGFGDPLVDFKRVGESKTAKTLLLNLGDIVANLISCMDESQLRYNVVKGFAFTTDEVLLISQQDSTGASLPTLDRHSEQGASIEFQWCSGVEIESWIAKKAWDGVAAQQSQGNGGCGIGGSNSEFAAATTAAEAVEGENHQVRKDLLACSSFVVRINIPHIKIGLSESQYTCILELIKCFVGALVHKDEEIRDKRDIVAHDTSPPLITSETSGFGAHPSQAFQTSILVQCGQVDVALHLKPQSTNSATLKQGAKVWDSIRVTFEKMQVLLVHGMGGANSFYMWFHHDDSEVTGSFLLDSSAVPNGKSEMLLMSCKSEALGRGDGGGGNALAAGKAGFTITYMRWPGQEELGDSLFTGTIRGITFVAHGGRLDWLSAVATFFNLSDQIESSYGTGIKSGISCPTENDSKHEFIVSSLKKPYFLLDLHDVALCYEPGPEAMLVPGVRAGRDSFRRDTSSSAESSQIIAPVACVVAAAAVRVSSRVAQRVTGEQYDIWLRDVALHLLDTALRRQTSFNYTTEAMHRTGYVQIAKEAVMEALVRIDGEDTVRWEVECANNQLRFDTCHDTTAAFGRLVAQLQQLFTPEFEQSGWNINSWKADGGGSGGATPGFSSRRAGDTGNIGDIGEVTSIDLFEGVLEDAFSRARSSWSSSGCDHDLDELQGETYTVVNNPIHSRVSSMDRYEFLDRDKLDQSGAGNNSVPSTFTQTQLPRSCTPSEEAVMMNNSGLPTFIEDYYVTAQKHASHSLGIMFSRQTSNSPHQSAGSSKHASRESSSSGRTREAEGRGGWYTGKGLEVVEDHVPEESTSVELGQTSRGYRQEHESQSESGKLLLHKKYPSSIARVVLRDLSARWRFYGGSDWPPGRVGQDQKSQCQSIAEESARQLGVCLEVLLEGMELQYDSFPVVGLYASRLVVSIRDIGVYDCSTDAPWKMVLGYHRSKLRPRESSSQAVKIEMDSVRPDPLAALEEYRLSIGLLPIRLHLDQRHIDFCVEFFSPRGPSSAGVFQDEGSYPLAGVTTSCSIEPPSDASDLVDDALLPFFQICEIRPFTIRVDYLPRRVDLLSLRGGNYAELLNLVTWKGIELHLKHVRAVGVHGWSSLSGVIFGEWLEDISQNQVHKFVKGVGPIRPLYAVGSGAAKLVVLPAESYKKDRRLLRGMRKGAIAFLRSISLEALGLGAQLAAGAHEILQQTELALGGAPIPTSFTSGKGERRSRAVQPGDTREGLQQACESISQGFERTAASLLGNPLKVYLRGAGAGLAVASALRAAPAAAVAPASAAAGAMHRALLGVRNEIDPEKKRESDEKHSGPPPDTRRVR